MAIFRNVPYGNARFTVEIDGVAQNGFTVVQLPEMSLEQAEYREGGELSLAAQILPNRPRFGTLLLKRGFRGSLDLYQWWKAASMGAADVRRTVRVSLHNEDNSAVVVQWNLIRAFPIRHGFAPLDGQDGGPLIEQVELACASVEME
jgi:phage tail-like protein